MNEIRCTSPICITRPDGIKGRLFVPPANAEGMAKLWCPDCIQLGNQLTFYANQTANMIKKVYHDYVVTELPKEVKLILEQFAREIVEALGGEL